jgi:ribosome-binding protein aMBF1 (putative translation factor)
MVSQCGQRVNGFKKGTNAQSPGAARGTIIDHRSRRSAKSVTVPESSQWPLVYGCATTEVDNNRREVPIEKTAIEKRFGMSVKTWRTRLKIPQDDLARRAGFHRSYISDIERGARNVSLKSIEKLADALGISVLTLFADLDSKTGSTPLRSDEMVDILLVEDNDNDTLLVV